MTFRDTLNTQPRMMKIENATGRAVIWNRKSLLQAEGCFKGRAELEGFTIGRITWMCWPHLQIVSDL